VLLADDEIYILTLFLGVIFAIMSLIVPLSRGGDNEKFSEGRAIMLVRILISPILAGIFFVLVGYMSGEINNCSLVFNTCWTDPTFSSVTSTITVSPFAPVLSLAFYGIAMIFFVTDIGVGLFMWRSIVEEAKKESETRRMPYSSQPIPRTRGNYEK
jgi:hypothetical protein